MSLPPRYFSDFYSELAEDKPALVLDLFRCDGVMLARRQASTAPDARLPPDSPILKMVTAGQSEGPIEGSLTLDDEDRLAYFRKLEHFPV